MTDSNDAVLAQKGVKIHQRRAQHASSRRVR